MAFQNKEINTDLDFNEEDNELITDILLKQELNKPYVHYTQCLSIN